MINAIYGYKFHVLWFLACIAFGQLIMQGDFSLRAKAILLALVIVTFLVAYAALILKMHRDWKAHDERAAVAIARGDVFPRFSLLNVLCLWAPLLSTLAAVPILFSFLR